MTSLLGGLGSGNRRGQLLKAGMGDGVRVALCALNAEPEQVADVADAAAVGVGFLEDAVSSHRLGSEIRFRSRGLSVDGAGEGDVSIIEDESCVVLLSVLLEHLDEGDRVAIRVHKVRLAPCARNGLDRRDVKPALFDGGGHVVEVGHSHGDQRLPRPGRVDDQVQPCAVGDPPHHVVLVDEHVWWSAEQLLIPARGGCKVGYRDPREEHVDLHVGSLPGHPAVDADDVNVNRARSRRLFGERRRPQRGLSSGNRRGRVLDVWVGDGVRVALGAFDAEPGEVPDSADVAAGGVDLLEDLDDPQRADHVVGLAFAPPVSGGVIAAEAA